jgi:hypothetical protein
MIEIFVEQKDDGTYRALLNGRTIATGTTQEETCDKSHELRPDAAVFAERVRNTKGGSRDKWRRVY